MILKFVFILICYTMLIDAGLIDKFANLTNLENSFDNIFESVNNNINKLSPKCPSICKQGNIYDNPDYNANYNGCGPESFPPSLLELVPYSNLFKECCNGHDLGYGTCNADKQQVDKIFLYCMIQTTKNSNNKELIRIVRKSFGGLFFSAVNLFGCPAWEAAQKKACKCNSSSESTTFSTSDESKEIKNLNIISNVFSNPHAESSS